MSVATITKSFPAIAKIWLISLFKARNGLTKHCSVIVGVWVELMLDWATGSSGMVVRVRDHVLALGLLHLLVDFLEDIDVCIVL